MSVVAATDLVYLAPSTGSKRKRILTNENGDFYIDTLPPAERTKYYDDAK
jgi:hypothetical protein